MPVANQPKLDPTCPGTWITPIPATVQAAAPELSVTTALADSTHYDDNDVSTLTGHVSIRQPGRLIDADHAELTQDRGEGIFVGNIFMAEPGLAMTGDQAEYDFNTQQSRIQRSEFVSSLFHAHGRADQVETNADGLIKIARGTFSTCPPDDRTWSFVARNIELNQDTGRGTVHDAVLHIKDYPVMYVPYFNFPIDDRRQSGLLVPRYGSTSDGGLDFTLPIYLNLAPNYDATVTPRLMTRRGLMLEGQFRYLLPYLGEGSIEGGYLPDDSTYGNRDRKSLSWKDSGNITPNLHLSTNVNYVSDSAYFIDLGSDLNMVNTTYLERTGQLSYSINNFWSLSTLVQGYQTIDPTITDYEKPYATLPKLLLVGGHPVARGWQPEVSTELAYFQRDITDNSGPQINGTRYRLDPSLGYVIESPWGHITPTVKLNVLAYDLSTTGTGAPPSGTYDLAVPSFNLDAGMVFERDRGHYQQTLEPRAFYLYSPYRNQSNLPNFDTATTTFSYEQLFRDSRFSGGDRIDDANQLSLGMTSRLISNDSGEEIMRASVGDIVYFRDRRVNLDPTDPIATNHTSGPVAQIAAPVGRGWSSVVDMQWTPDMKQATQYSVNFNYLPPSRDRLFNIGYSYLRQDTTIDQVAEHQINASLIQPIGINWQVIGLWQYDLLSSKSQDLIVGAQYEACCWTVRLYERQFLADPDDISPTTQRQRTAFFIEVELKGLSGVSSGIKGLLDNNMFGYNQLLGHQSSKELH